MMSGNLTSMREGIARYGCEPARDLVTNKYNEPQVHWPYMWVVRWSLWVWLYICMSYMVDITKSPKQFTQNRSRQSCLGH
jgi:hypothetical protein